MDICIVDDSNVVRNLVKKALEMHGYSDFVEASDGVDALEKIRGKQQDIGLYVLDVNMPNMDGITLVQEIRKINGETPIIMLTTETDKAKMTKAKELGATGWIIKPFETEKFISVIDMFLKK